MIDIPQSRQSQDRPQDQNLSSQPIVQYESKNLPQGFRLEQHAPIPQSVHIPSDNQPRDTNEYRLSRKDQDGPVSRNNPPPLQYIPNSFYVEDTISNTKQQDNEQRPFSKQNELTTAEKLINWVIYIIPIFFMIISSILMVMVLIDHNGRTKNPAQSQGIINYVITNLQQNPIQDIVSLSANGTVFLEDVKEEDHLLNHIKKKTTNNSAPANVAQCPAGYSIAILGSWAGVKSGCLCSDGTVQTQIYCTFHSSNCQVVKQQNAVQLTSWKSQQICVLPSLNWTYVGSQACATNYKQCQPGICVPAGGVCPMTTLTQSSKPDPSNLNNYINIDGVVYQKIVDLTNQPIIGFAVTAGVKSNAPCFDANVAPSFQSSQFYPLANQPQSGCDAVKQTSAFTQELANQPANHTFKSNNLTSILANIPYYNSYIASTDTYNLQAIQRLKLGGNPACDNLNSNDFNTVLTRSTQLDFLSKWVSIVIISLGCFGVTTLVILFIMRSRQLDTCHMNDIHQTKIIYMISMVVAGLLIAQFALYIHNVDTQGGLSDLHAEFQNYISQQCFAEAPIQATITSIDKFSYDTYSKTGPVIKTGFVLSLSFIVLSIILVLVQRFKFKEAICVDPWRYSDQYIQ